MKLKVRKKKQRTFLIDLDDLRILEGTTVVNPRNGCNFVLDSIIGTDLTRGGWIFRSRFTVPSAKFSARASTSTVLSTVPTEGVVTLKVIDKSKTTEYEKLCNNFNASLELSSLLRNHPNIVVASHCFNYEDRRTCRMFSFVSFPYSSEGSIRSILNQRYPNGVPKNVAGVILKDMVCGLLSAYHTTGLSHNFIHSGAIYVNNEEGVALLVLDSDCHPPFTLTMPMLVKEMLTTIGNLRAMDKPTP